jgi:Glutamine synthetase
VRIIHTGAVTDSRKSASQRHFYHCNKVGTEFALYLSSENDSYTTVEKSLPRSWLGVVSKRDTFQATKFSHHDDYDHFQESLSMSAEHVLSMMNEHEVKFVDLRFTDTKGKEQHVTIPAHQVNADFFEEGKMFDGSSIGGWKGINESDMVLMPDATTAVMDPFFEDPTLIIRCDILEPGTLQGYDRDPRSIAKRAEEFLRSSGIADTVLFGPEPEFFLFDDIRFGSSTSGSHVAIG